MNTTVQHSRGTASEFIATRKMHGTRDGETKQRYEKKFVVLSYHERITFSTDLVCRWMPGDTVNTHKPRSELKLKCTVG